MNKNNQPANDMQKALDEAMKRVKEKEPQFHANTVKATSQRKKLR
jgi:hypothetical protein